MGPHKASTDMLVSDRTVKQLLAVNTVKVTL